MSAVKRRYTTLTTTGCTGSVVRALQGDRSLLLFPPTNPLRAWLHAVTSAPQFDTCIMVCIVISSLTLTLESPKYTAQWLKDALFVSDNIFLVIFCLEFIVKAIATGFLFGRHAYLQDAWNRLDFFVVVVTLASVASGGSGAGRTLRVGRILRPLRMINRNENMKVVINALLRSLPAVGYTVVLLLLFFFIFGILGINLFAGKFYFCNDPGVVWRSQCVGTFLAGGLPTPRVWANPSFSFDNIGAASLTLLKVVSLKGWVPVLNAATDVTDIDEQPIKNNSPVMSLYFIVFIFIGAFYMMRLFVGIIVSHFRQFSGTALHTEAQVQWLVMKRFISAQSPELPPPAGATCVRGVAHKLVGHPWFEHVVTAIILLHLALLATQQADEAQSWTDFLDAAHYVFVAVYAAEICLRMLAHGIRGYLRNDSPWSYYDVAVTIVMLVAPSIGLRKGVGILRALRFGRVVKVLTKLEGLSRLLEVLANSLGAMANITALLLLVLFVYAVLGMQFFASTKFGTALTPTANFETFLQAALTLFQIICGEVWLTLMEDCSVTVPNCTPAHGDVASDCGDAMLGPLFFFSFFILTFAVFLNLYVAAILDTYSSSKADGAAQAEWQMSMDDYSRFKAAWAKYDPTGTAGILPAQVEQLMAALTRSGHTLGAAGRSALQHDVRMEFARHMMATQVGSTPAKLFAKDSTTRLKFTTVLLPLAMSNVAEDALETQQQVDLGFARRTVAARRIARLFVDNKHRLQTWTTYRQTLPLSRRFKRGRRPSRLANRLTPSPAAAAERRAKAMSDLVDLQTRMRQQRPA